MPDSGTRTPHPAPRAHDFFPRVPPCQGAEGDVDEKCVALAGIRRSLIFPYLRVWDLGVLVGKDVRDILAAGKRCILRCLLQVCPTGGMELKGKGGGSVRGHALSGSRVGDVVDRYAQRQQDRREQRCCCFVCLACIIAVKWFVISCVLWAFCCCW